MVSQTRKYLVILTLITLICGGCGTTNPTQSVKAGAGAVIDAKQTAETKSYYGLEKNQFILAVVIVSALICGIMTLLFLPAPPSPYTVAACVIFALGTVVVPIVTAIVLSRYLS